MLKNKKSLKKFLSMELIGVGVKIIDSKNKSYIGIKGKIVDETKNTFVIRTSKGKKRVLKKNTKFEMDIQNTKIMVNGDILAKRPEERIKNASFK